MSEIPNHDPNPNDHEKWQRYVREARIAHYGIEYVNAVQHIWDEMEARIQAEIKEEASRNARALSSQASGRYIYNIIHHGVPTRDDLNKFRDRR